MCGTRALFGLLMAAVCLCAQAAEDSIAKFDPRMGVEEGVVVSNGVKWIDGKLLPLEGRAFDDTEAYYDRLPANLSTNINAGVHKMKHDTTGMQFRFSTDSKTLRFHWVPWNRWLSMDHMPATGVSGIDVYGWDETRQKWCYLKTGRITNTEGTTVELAWHPGRPCLVNLPLYNGIRKFELGIDEGATVKPLPPRKSGVTKSVVFYGTSITHGGCASRPGLSFVNIVGRDLDVPVVNLGFSGSGRMEIEMEEPLARIDASCYVLDCLWNMDCAWTKAHYEPFIRKLRAERPDTPIVMADRCNVFCQPPNEQSQYVKALYDKLIAEGWKKLYYLPADEMYLDDNEGTVDGCHPNDWGMMQMAKAYGKAVKEALKK